MVANQQLQLKNHEKFWNVNNEVEKKVVQLITQMPLFID